ncbi:hypothetical protein [Micromonospora sp. NPDC049679]|uniref:hypothetical protein n=1 Tax=Micromonospora sp. NPDC049679 TaxID=3155920 RepID=UPI0033C00964
MAVRGWVGSVAGAIGIAAGVSAAQLGLGYGLGIIAWLPATDRAGEAAWVASLAWAAWIGATSTVVGSVCAQRLFAERTPQSTLDGERMRPSAVVTVLSRLALATAAAVGALVTVALVAVPARGATRADTFSPQTIAAGYAVVGVVGGLLMAIWALASRAAAANVVATVAWLWLLAVVAVVDGALSGRGLTSAQLGVWQITTDSDRFWFRDYFYWPGAVLSLGSALLIGALAAWPAARRSENRVGGAISGGVGPLLVAAAYFLAAPRLAGIRAEQLSAHLMAPYAVIAGLAGSVLITAMIQRAQPSPRSADAAAPEHDEPAPSPSAEQSDNPLPTDQPAPVYTPAPVAERPRNRPARGTAAVSTAVRPVASSVQDAPKGKPRRAGRRPQ